MSKRRCQDCLIPLVPRTPGRTPPEGHAFHQARGRCSPCYETWRGTRSHKAAEDGDPRGWEQTPFPDPEWSSRGWCRYVPWPDMFFPEGRGMHTADDARAICRDCPVQRQCLDYALTYPAVKGIWGGTTDKQRMELRRDMRRRKAS